MPNIPNPRRKFVGRAKTWTEKAKETFDAAKKYLQSDPKAEQAAKDKSDAEKRRRRGEILPKEIIRRKLKEGNDRLQKKVKRVSA